jgi:DNA-binding NarL/FixJ family response regulator
MTSAKILIIEDQAPMRRNVALMLEMEGYTVFTAADGKLGVEVARQQKPDLILCDVMMPNMDGHEVVKQLRADDAFASTPFIFLTAKGDRSDIREGMNFGADDYLIKPVVRADLLAAIETRLTRAEAIRAKIEQAGAGFQPDFENPLPLQTTFGLTPREAEVLCWVAQGKSNSDVATILNMSEKTVKQHLGVCFQKMGVESRTAASLAAVEALAGRRG